MRIIWFTYVFVSCEKFCSNGNSELLNRTVICVSGVTDLLLKIVYVCYILTIFVAPVQNEFRGPALIGP